MNRLDHKIENQAIRLNRVRSRVYGSKDRPRLTVNVSNRHLIAQIIDDSNGITIAYVSTVGAKTSGNMTDKAKWVGEQIADKAKAKKIKKVVFDRGSRLYHGRVKALAEASRQKGLEF